jgi:hypothetical protein
LPVEIPADFKRKGQTHGRSGFVDGGDGKGHFLLRIKQEAKRVDRHADIARVGSV